jgi:hypothetical protein
MIARWEYNALRLSSGRTRRLRQEYDEAFKDESTTNFRLYEALDHRARHEGLQLAKLMCGKLPMELRNLVYQFLCIEDQPIPVGPYYHFRRYGPRIDGDSNTDLATSLSIGRMKFDHSETPDPTILMPDNDNFKQYYLGSQVASEALTIYLAYNTFSVCNVEGGINGFLGFDPESIVQPLEHVRKLQIRIKYEHNNIVLSQDLPMSPAMHRERFANECNVLRNTKNSLDILRQLPQKTQPLQLEFILMTAFGGDGDEHRRFVNLLEAVRNTIYALMYDRDDANVIIIHHDELLSPFPRNITALWSLSKEQWQHVRASPLFLSCERPYTDVVDV